MIQEAHGDTPEELAEEANSFLHDVSEAMHNLDSLCTRIIENFPELRPFAQWEIDQAETPLSDYDETAEQMEAHNATIDGSIRDAFAVSAAYFNE